MHRETILRKLVGTVQFNKDLEVDTTFGDSDLDALDDEFDHFPRRRCFSMPAVISFTRSLNRSDFPFPEVEAVDDSIINGED